jgi:hypothetical protein
MLMNFSLYPPKDYRLEKRMYFLKNYNFLHDFFLFYRAIHHSCGVDVSKKFFESVDKFPRSIFYA